MAKKPISDKLLLFIAENIRSVEQLEILCLLAEDRSRLWSAADMFRCIQSSEQSVLNCLQHFVQKNLATLSDSEGFRFAPGTPSQKESVETLMAAYRERRMAIIEAIYQSPRDSAPHWPKSSAPK